MLIKPITLITQWHGYFRLKMYKSGEKAYKLAVKDHELPTKSLVTASKSPYFFPRMSVREVLKNGWFS
ncbi:hypothetical protein HMPREF2140_03110 [Hoylesella buccalis DNF00985]|nr:hypothetical protein HMPREF2140_03110 [Hoylesella buccalis DNF00985]